MLFCGGAGFSLGGGVVFAMLPVGDVPDGAVWRWGSTSGRSGWIEEGVLRRGRCRGKSCRQAARAVWVTDAAPGMWSVCVENGVLSRAALLVVLSNGAFCRECGAGGSGGGCCAERFCAGQDGFWGAGGALDVEQAGGHVVGRGCAIGRRGGSRAAGCEGLRGFSVPMSGEVRVLKGADPV